MTGVFIVCAALGGTILVCQLLATIAGLGGHSLHFDSPGSLDGDLGSVDVHTDLGAGHDAAGDTHTDGTGHDQAESSQQAHDHHQVARLFSVLSFRTVVAALTFFGLAGLAAQSAGASTPTVLLVATGAGVAALYGVYFLVRSMYSLKAEGTVRIDRAIGRLGSVYLRIPPHDSGCGKIQLNLQNRTVEYLATTTGAELPTGARIVVVRVINPTTVAVEAASEPERNDHVS